MSRNRGAHGHEGAWDGGPPGAEADYAYSGYPQVAYSYSAPVAGPHAADPRYAAYEPVPPAAGYPPYTMSRYPPPPSDPVPRYPPRVTAAPPESRYRRSPSSSSDESARRARSPRRRRRSRSARSPSGSSDSSPQRPQRRRHNREHKSSERRHDREQKSVERRHNREHKSPERQKGKYSEKCDTKKSRLDNKNESAKAVPQRRTVTPEMSALRHRERSITPPKSYKTRARSSSSSSSSSDSSSTHSHSVTPSRTHTPPLSRQTRSQSRPSRSRSRSWSGSPHHRSRRSHSPSPACSRSPDRHSDSSSSSRGRFSGYDRKRYFRKLKEEQQAKKQQELLMQQQEPPSEEGPAPAGLSEEAAEIPSSPPSADVDGVNFEDLPPPPAELCGRPGSRRAPIAIPNDGSFLEMFKRMQEESRRATEPEVPAPRRPVLPFIGKRRGGRVLKTGVVKKTKAPVEAPDAAPKDAWSLYMQEVKKYRETSCEEERKTRPLVK